MARVLSKRNVPIDQSILLRNSSQHDNKTARTEFRSTGGGGGGGLMTTNGDFWGLMGTKNHGDSG